MVKRLQTDWNRVIQKTAQATGYLTGNNTAEDKTNKSQEIYILPEKEGK